MALYLKLLLMAIVLVVIVMGVYGLKLFHDRGARFNVESDPEKYKKIKKDGIYSVYSKENRDEEDGSDEAEQERKRDG
jgi:protein-S-isoprenylcysteine O-methyltransferase Ste14